MATFIMLSTLTDEGAKTIKTKPERIREVNKELAQLGATVKAQYAMALGLPQRFATANPSSADASAAG